MLLLLAGVSTLLIHRHVPSYNYLEFILQVFGAKKVHCVVLLPAGFAVLVEGRRAAARDLAGGMAGELRREPQQRGCHDRYSHALVLGEAGKCWLKGEMQAGHNLFG